MPILVSGSIAFDTIIQTLGDFRSQDNLANSDLNLSLFAPTIRKEYGGTAGNIAYSLALLGKNPHVIASVWEDANEALIRMKEMGIYTELINVTPGSFSAQAYIIRDQKNGQINTFHPGAMSTSGELTHGNIPFQYAIIAPDSKEGMIRRMYECVNASIFTIFDPGQAMGIFEKDELKSMIKIADITIMNEPERAQFRDITWEDFIALALQNWHIWIETLWEKWAIIVSESYKLEIPALKVKNIIDATGCGDAWRAGLLYGLSEWWDIEISAQLGSILGGIKIQSMGGQNHSISKREISEISEREFGRKLFE